MKGSTTKRKEIIQKQSKQRRKVLCDVKRCEAYWQWLIPFNFLNFFSNSYVLIKTAFNTFYCVLQLAHQKVVYLFVFIFCAFNALNMKGEFWRVGRWRKELKKRNRISPYISVRKHWLNIIDSQYVKLGCLFSSALQTFANVLASSFINPFLPRRF